MKNTFLSLLVLAAFAAVSPVQAQFAQQGLKLVGTGPIGIANQGTGVAISADGNTAIVGAPSDNGNVGAAWVYTRSGGVWTQQTKLTPGGAIGYPRFGRAVSLSTDGNIALVGGPMDNDGAGAFWVYTRSAGVWSQEIKKTGAGQSDATARFGSAVSLAGDGSAALIGAPNNAAGNGMAVRYLRTGGTWSTAVGTTFAGGYGSSVALEPGGRYAAIGAPGADTVFTFDFVVFGPRAQVNGNAGSRFGESVAVSADGSALAVGAPGDNGGAGQTWFYAGTTFSGLTLNGTLAGTGNAGLSQQGKSMAMTSDGNTLVVGGPGDNSNKGAFWTFTRHAGVWSQNGTKQSASDNTGSPQSAASIGVSSDGLTALTGGPLDNSGAGAAWVYVGGPDFTIAKSHGGAQIFQGQSGVPYTITVQNQGLTASSGLVTVVDTLPLGMIGQQMSGQGWTCTLSTRTCTRSDVLQPFQTYPAITLKVGVANNAGTSLINTATVTNGSDINGADNVATDPTTITQAPDLGVTISHSGTFQRGNQVQYLVTITNNGPVASSPATVTFGLGAGQTLVSAIKTSGNPTFGVGSSSSTGFTGNLGVFAGSEVLQVTVTVTLGATAPSPVTASASLTNGGYFQVNDTAQDSATLSPSLGLSIVKGHITVFQQGDIGRTYTITVTNTTTSPTSGITSVTDTLPAGLTATAIAGTGWGCTLATLTCTRNDSLAAGASFASITVTVNVAANAAALINNQASATSSGTTNTAIDPTVVATGPDLTIVKSHTGSFTQGQTGATYSITVSNVGGTATSGTVMVTDALPGGLTATGMSGAGWSCTLAVLRCTRVDSLGVSSSYPPIAVTVAVATNAGNLINTATVSGGNEVNTGNDTASDPTTILALPDLSIAKTHTGNFTPGQTGATYTITVTNSGGTPTSGTVTVTDTLPVGLTATAIAGTNWSCVLASLSCTRSTALAVAQSYETITVTVNVAPAAAANLVNTATVSGGGEANTSNNTASDATTVGTGADLTISKTHTGFTQGQAGSYTITVTNNGNAGSSGAVTVTDTLPGGITYTGFVATGWDCSASTPSTVVSCTRSNSLGAGASYPTIQVNVAVATNAPASVTNTATVSGGGDLNSSNNSATDIATITQVADLVITKSHSGTFTAGQAGVTYTLSVNNQGSGAASGTVTVTEVPPGTLTGVVLTGSGWSCAALSCTRSDALAAGASYPAIIVTANISAAATGTLINNASVSGGGEVVTSNDSASDSATLAGAPDLTVTKSPTGPLTQGQQGLTYTLTVTNSGTATTAGTVTVSDVMPTGLTAVSATGSGWTCVIGATVTCTTNATAAAGNAFAAITLTVNVSSTAPASMVNTVTVSGGGEVNTTNNSATDTSAVAGAADLTIAKTHGGSLSQSQASLVYSITVTNIGRGTSSGTVTVTDTLPTGLTFGSMTGTNWTCVALTCTRNDGLAGAGSYETIFLTVSVNSNAPTPVTNSVTVSGGSDVNLLNNSASDTAAVLQVPDLTITKTHPANFARSQTGATYTIVVTNSGAGPVVAGNTVTVVDSWLPLADLTLTGLAGTGWNCVIGTATCTRSDGLAAGASYPSILVTVTVSGAASANIANTATVSGGGEVVTSNNTFTDNTPVSSGANLAITKTHTGTLTAGAVVSYTIRVTNTGTLTTTAAGVTTVTDNLPGGLTGPSMSGSGWACAAPTCTRTGALAPGLSFPDITYTATVAANPPGSISNVATVGVDNSANDTVTADNTATDTASLAGPGQADLTITKTHTGNFPRNAGGNIYTITVRNAGSGPSSGTVTVTDTLPAGLTAQQMNGLGWTCNLAARQCTRADVLAAGASYPAISLKVATSTTSPTSVVNTVTVAGGGDGNPGNNTASDPTNIGEAPPTAATKFLVALPGSVVAGQAFTFTVTAQDQSSNTVTGYAGVVHFTSSDGTALLPANATLNQGIGVFSATLTKSTSQTVAATDTASVNITGFGAITVIPAAANHYTIGVPASITAGNSFTATVTAFDIYNNVATNYGGTVQITTNDGQAVLPANSVLTNGVKGFPVTLKTAGSRTITATDTVNGALTLTSSGITVNPAPTSKLNVAPASITPTAGAPYNVTVTAQDPYGNTTPSYIGTVHFTTSDTGTGFGSPLTPVLPADNTLVNGVRVFTGLKLITAAPQTVTVTDTVVASITGTANVTVQPALPAFYVVTDDSGGAVTAGVNFNLTVEAQDQYHNRSTNYTIYGTHTVHFTSNDTFISPGSGLPANYTYTVGDAGRHTFVVQFRQASPPNRTITATDTLIPCTGTSGGITVSPAATSQFLVSAATPQTAGTAFNVTVTARDQFTNTTPAYTGTVTVSTTPNDAQGVYPAGHTYTGAGGGNDNGVFVFSLNLKTSGTYTIKATDGTNNGQVTNRVVNPAGASQYVFSGVQASVVAGAANAFTITAQDPYGNTATGYPNATNVTLSNTDPFPGTFTTNPIHLTSGVGTINYKLYTVAGNPWTITATDGTISKTTGGIAVTPGIGTNLQFTSYPANWDSTQQQTVVATAYDAYGNVDTNNTHTVRLSTTDSSSYTQDTTPVNGVYTYVVPANTMQDAGFTRSITVTDQSATQTMTPKTAAINIF